MLFSLFSKLMTEFPVGASLFVFFIGACFGSFLNVLAFRVPKNQSIIFPSSRCPNCGFKIPVYFNIPILGFFFSKGVCCNCSHYISLKYPLVELITAILSLLTFKTFGISWLLIINLILIYYLIVISIVDFDLQIIPDKFSYSGIFFGLFLSTACDHITLINSFTGALAGSGFLLLTAWVYSKLTGREGLGGGDVKFMAMIGAFTGIKPIFLIIFLSSVLGVIGGISMMLFYRKSLRYKIPFGPYIAVATILTIFFEKPLFRLMFF